VKQFISANASARKRCKDKPGLGGSWLAANDLNFSQRLPGSCQTGDTADLQRVARQYLTAENRTLYALLPSGGRAAGSRDGETFSDQPISKFEFGKRSALVVKEDHQSSFVEFRCLNEGWRLVRGTPEKNGYPTCRKMLLKERPGDPPRTLPRNRNGGWEIDSYGRQQYLGLNAEVLSGERFAWPGSGVGCLVEPGFPRPLNSKENGSYSWRASERKRTNSCRARQNRCAARSSAT